MQTKKAEYTPTPWKIFNNMIISPAGDAELGNWFVADLERNTLNKKEDMEFIVAACNAHEQLVEAIKSALEFWHSEEPSGMSHVQFRSKQDEIGMKLKQALTKAGVKP